MLRSTWCLVILAAGLVMVGGLGLSMSEASPRHRRKPAKAAAVVVDRPSENEVDGYGRNDREARHNALVNAQERVTELVRERIGDPSWEASGDLLDPEYLVDQGVIAEVRPPERDGDADVVARYKIQLTDDYLRTVQKQAKQERMLGRHLLVGRVLVGMLAVLLVAAGYLRLEEMTRGYATQLLRLAAFAVLGLVGFVIWLTM